jgi:hypothetical protein
MNPRDCTLYSGGAAGAEADFGVCAERYGVNEVNFTCAGHGIARQRGVRLLSEQELLHGDVSLDYVSKLMHRRYTDAPTIRRILQTIWYQVSHGQEIFIVGAILDDGTVQGGTGWGAELAKLFNKPLYVFDQPRDGWFKWGGDEWAPLSGSSLPVITQAAFTGSGTRSVRPNGRVAVETLFARSFQAS